MSVFKDKWNGYNGQTWKVEICYVNWKGKKCTHSKRGFKTKKEALKYESEYKAKISGGLDMGFSAFIDIYLNDLKPQLKLNTYLMKESVINTHIRQYFGHKALVDISPVDILQWQNELLGQRDSQGKGYSPTYLRTIETQLSAIMNHAVRYYNLPKNPCHVTKRMGKSKASEMMFWMKDEYMKFAEAVKDKPVSYYAFEVLFWTGIRCGELLALTKADFDFEKRVLTINKSLQTLKGKVVVTTPKTEKSNRKITLPDFLCNEMQDYFAALCKADDDVCIFPITKSYLHHELDRGATKAGVKRIRLHDLRHSHCAHLISLGYSPVQIAERLGHESSTITERYSHLYPTVQSEMAQRLNQSFEEGDK